MVRILFYGKGLCFKENSAQIECVSESNEIVLTIEVGEKNCFISLDKSTAIRLAKKLRTEINRIQEGGING